MKLKSPLINVDNKHNEFFQSFNNEFIAGKCLVDTFSDCFSFHSHTLNIQKHMEKLEEIAIRVSSDPYSSIIMSDANIKNQVAIFILYIHSFNKPIIKTLHRAIYITTTEAELLLLDVVLIKLLLILV